MCGCICTHVCMICFKELAYIVGGLANLKSVRWISRLENQTAGWKLGQVSYVTDFFFLPSFYLNSR